MLSVYICIGKTVYQAVFMQSEVSAERFYSSNVPLPHYLINDGKFNERGPLPITSQFVLRWGT